MNEYITLAEAARIAGYRSKSPLKAAALTGRLQTIRLGMQFFTQRTWLDDYLASVKQRGTRRGEHRQAPAPIDGDAWFYSPEGQVKEREVDKDLAAGQRGQVYLQSNLDDLIGIPEAASIVGHSDPTTLYAAAREWLAWKAQTTTGADAGPERGLRVQQVGPKTRLTTRTWLEEYRQRMRSGGYRRGLTKAAETESIERGGTA